jgi:adenosine deaminase
MISVKQFIQGLPKAELHMHLGGTIEPEMAFTLAQKNHIPLRFASVEELRAAYKFTDLQSFLDLLVEMDRVLVEEEDFYLLTKEYLRQARADNVIHTEVFFEPQVHAGYGIPYSVMMSGIIRAFEDGGKEYGMTSRLIICFLRDKSEEDAFHALESLKPFWDKIHGFGISSTEQGNPPSKFQRVFQQCRELGFHTVAHAGEEGPPAVVYEALDILKVDRIDHGVRSIEDQALVERLAAQGVPLTITPMSNIMLCVFPTMKDHSIKKLMDAGVCVTISSDDPAYFGGYINVNYEAVQEAFDLTLEEITLIAKNSFKASFLPEEQKRAYLHLVDEYVAQFTKERHLHYLRIAIEVSKRARAAGNTPFGAILVDKLGNILVEQGNIEVTESNCTGHAETTLMEVASKHWSKSELWECTMYTSVEPCVMCAGAIYWGNVGRVVYGITEKRLLDLTGDPEQIPMMDLPCRTVFAAGGKPIEAIGPFPEVDAEVIEVHEGYWS